MYAATIFVSAFLLFLVQPLLAKQILPWFGGAAIVWTLCMVFFQLVLLLGYTYAHWLAKMAHGARQASIHIALIMVSLAFLPMAPDAGWKPHGDENPMVRILLLLFATVGLPYLLLSSTSPLVQSWFARTRPGASPYRLFALSNLASMTALLGYPFMVEPWLTNRQQSLAWSAGYALFALLCAGLAWASRRLPPQATQAGISAAVDPEPSPQPRIAALWFTLAATASALLLGVTNHLSHNISSVPLLWVVPLATYLLTFILTFESARWYRPRAYLGAVVCMVATMAWFLADRNLQNKLPWHIAVFTAGLFVVCMFCHGELAARRPGARHLTLFYLVVSLGGVAGGALVGIVAPVVLPAYLEVEIALVIVVVLAAVTNPYGPRWVHACLVVLLAGTIGALGWRVHALRHDLVRIERNYYGVLRVSQERVHVGADEVWYRTLEHGNVAHGSQLLSEKYRRTPTRYFTQSSGIGRTLLTLRGRPLSVGIIGLGVGTIAAYADAHDTYIFYEIDPAVVGIAARYFTFVPDALGSRGVVLGDARLSLERDPAQRFDVLAVDAFSGDSIPTHLITVEAVSEYLRHLNPDGVIAFHVTNGYLDLKPVLLAIAQRHHLEYAYIHDKDASGATLSDWILLTRNKAFLLQPRIAEATEPVAPRPDWRIWTDDYNNLWQVFRR
jgi:hypothetical protein